MSHTSLTSALLARFVALVGVAAVAASLAIHASRPDLAPIRSDGYSYHVYLPAWIIHHRVDLDPVADDCCGGVFPAFTAITRWPSTGRWLNAHPIGVALMASPFFVAAHLMTSWSNLPPDGFSTYYQVGAALAGLAYTLVGLACLRRLLRRHVSDGVALAALAVTALGTNLLNYAVYDATYSHAYSFGLVCALLLLTELWWERATPGRSLALGGVAALLVLVRHANALFLPMVLLFGLVRPADVAAQCRQLAQRWSAVLVAAAAFAAVLLPQLALYRHVTGQWLVFSYSNIGATWTAPHVGRVLFSVQKGLFFWSPVLLLAIPGVFLARGSLARWRVPTIVVLSALTLLVSCWWDWQFGGSFGHRGFTDALGLFALPLAATFTWLADRPRLARVAAPVVAALVALSLAQLVQYWLQVLPAMDTTWDQYRHLFLRFSAVSLPAAMMAAVGSPRPGQRRAAAEVGDAGAPKVGR